MREDAQNKEVKMTSGVTRRQFMKGLAVGAAGISLAAILPGCGSSKTETTTAAPAETTTAAAAPEPAAKEGGIFIQGGDVNMNGQTYTLEFIQPVKLVAMIDGVEVTDGVWRSSNKHLVSVDPLGTIQMKDGVGGYDVDVTWTKEDTVYTVTFHTSQLMGPAAIQSDSPMYRGDFMIRLAKYFGWYHYNNVMDDGTDIDENGEIMTTERVRNFYDVTGRNDYVKPIECALDQGVITAESPEDCFYPMSIMSRQDAAVILVKAFHLAEVAEDYLTAFEDAGSIDPECYQALNTLVAMNVMRGRSNTTLNPADGITDTEARIIIENIHGKMVSPVWSMPVSHRKFVRVRPEWKTATEGATVHWRCRAFNISHDAMKGLFIQDRGAGVVLDDAWGEWYNYVPGFGTVPMFGLNNNSDFPYENVYFCVEVEAYATKEGLMDSPVTKFVWRIDRPAWFDFAVDKLHEGGDNFPTVYRFFDNFQAAAYYIEGSEMGILYDGLTPTNTSTTLYSRVKDEFATKPFFFVLGHNHPDHMGAMASCFDDGLDIYLADRVGPVDGEWTINVYNKEYTSGNPVIDSTKTGTYTGANVKTCKEGDVFDLGNCKFEVLRLPGHCDDQLMIYDRANGLLFSSDIYGVNRYWVADQFGASGMKQDMVLSLHQQLMDVYTKDGGAVKELYTGHNRIGVGADYLMAWERAFQNVVNYGPSALSDDLRGDGSLVSREGHHLETMNWQAVSMKGKAVIADYVGQYNGEAFQRFELDRSEGSQNPNPDINLYFDYKTNAHLSNVTFKDATLVGHDFPYKIGMDTPEMNYAEALTPDGRPKYVIENKFVPMDTEYTVKIASGQAEVTFTPTSMSEMITGMTVNGKPAASRCPVTVATDAPAVVVVTGPDGATTVTYTFTFEA